MSRGSASVLAIGLVAVSGSLVVATAAVGHAVSVAVALDGAADAAALAAADAAVGYVTEEPCAVAGRAAALNAARLVECRVTGAEVTVAVSTSVFGIPTTSRARAGPPGDPVADDLPPPGAT
jgi:secretion/DNA translocation related TadE-like protein